jgi:hypothetical protein
MIFFFYISSIFCSPHPQAEQDEHILFIFKGKKSIDVFKIRIEGIIAELME